MNIVYSQSPLGYTRFLTSRIKSIDILEPTRPETFYSSQLFEFAVYSDRAGVLHNGRNRSACIYQLNTLAKTCHTYFFIWGMICPKLKEKFK